ncbi:hypothetical protein KR009_006039 [Drosophila setifemur]|nr:hypothetical protein KR009_006039 [Drosophila setifemur]
MFKFKFSDFGLFVLLTSMHVCSVLQPVVEAQANIKTVYPTVDRSLLLQLGYKYNHWMLAKSMMYSLLVVIGLGYCRHLQQLGKREAEERRGILKDANLSTADDVKRAWLAAGRVSFAFPRSKFLLFALPWALTFVASGVINYIRLNLIVHHFCVSNWRTVQLYGELQYLFLRRLLAVALIPYWTQIIGGANSLKEAPALPANFISFETHLLD